MGPSPVIWFSLPLLYIVEVFAGHLFQLLPGFRIEGPHISPVHSPEKKKQGLSQVSENDFQFWAPARANPYSFIWAKADTVG